MLTSPYGMYDWGTYQIDRSKMGEKYLFKCYELQYANKEIYFEKNDLYVNPIIPFNNEFIKTASDYKREEIQEKQVKQLRRDEKRSHGTHLWN